MVDVSRWLAEQGLGHHAEAFAENGVAGDILCELTDSDLKQLGLNLGDRKRLLKAIAALPAAGLARDNAEAAGRTAPPLEARDAERRQLTVLFCDLVGSTELSGRLDPEKMSEVIRAYHAGCADVIRRWGGYVAKYMGDGVLAYYGWPRAHEDDAERAVRAGLELAKTIGQQTASDGTRLAARIGIATGQVVVGELFGEGAAQEEAVVGETPNLVDCLQRLMPASDAFEDVVGVGGPDERLGVMVVGLDEAVDRSLQVDDRAEHTALEPPPGELGEEGLDGVQPRARGRREVERETRMAGEPGADLGVLVGAIVVEDHVDHLAGRHGSLDRIQEADEFLMPVAGHAAPDQGALEDVQSREQRGGAVALVVVGHGAEPARLDRQSGLGAVERLNLRLLVDREHHRMRRRIDVQADDVPELGSEGGIPRQLKGLQAVGLQTVGLPDPLHRGARDADRLGHGADRPVGRLPGGGAPVRLSTWSTVSVGNGAMPGGRDFSRNSPAIPAVMNRSCQRQTVGLATPACRAIAIVPTPSPLKRMIRARQTCFCGLPGAATIASRRARSPALTAISTPDLILRSLHGSQSKGIFR